MKKRLIPVVIIVALALLAGLFWHRSNDGPGGDRLTLYGNIDVRVVNLAFEVNGRLKEMLAAEGARVAAGQPLARLDTQRLNLDLQSTRARVAAARIEAANAKRNAARLSDLAKRHLASPRDIDDARAAAEAAAAQVHVAEAAQALAEKNLADAVLTAPAAGIVQSRILEPGDMVSPDRPVYTLAMSQPLWARIYIAEPDLGKVKPGMPAVVHSDSYPGQAYRGWIGYISPSAEFTPKSVETTEIRADLVYQARVYVCNPQNELRQGMPVTVTLDLKAAPVAAPGCGGAAGGAKQ